jgi:hypothetical protein
MRALPSAFLRLLAAAALGSASADAAPLQVVTFNTFGLPPVQGFVPDRTAEFAAIAPLLETLHAQGPPTVLALQEVFHAPYYSTLTNPATHTYPDVTAKDNGGPSGIGDGLTLMSDPVIDFFTRTQWADCFGTGGLNGSDCDTNKGFVFARITLAPGAELDLYTLHADAGQDTSSRAARQANILQLIASINTNSSGRAVIVLGDTNSLYTRSTDNIGLVLSSLGLQDAWIETALGGATPGFGAANNTGCPPPRGNATGGAVNASGSTCELVDKIFFRGSAQLQLSLLDYEVLLNFVDGNGAPLSDHLPVTAMFDYQLVPEPMLAALLSVGAASIASRRRIRL